MKETGLNSLSTNQRRYLQIGVLIILIIFLVFFFWKTSKVSSGEVSLESSVLKVFNDSDSFEGFPDRIYIHYPYFILVQANKPLTIIYNLESGNKEKEYKDVLLDYYDGNILYNRKETYFNDKNLGEFCDSAYIKSTTEVLCITKRSRDSIDNMLISINPEKPNLWKQVYQSDNILTTVSYIDDTLYLGEINYKTKQNYLSIATKPQPVQNMVNLIYSLQGKPHYASFGSPQNNHQVSYYIIEEDKIVPQPTGKIVFYKK